MTKLKLFLITLLSVVSFYASAGNPEDDPFYNDNGYSAKECRKVTNPKSACNQGAEPFYKFIKKFKTNSAFRKSRYKDSSLYNNGFDEIIVQSLNTAIGSTRKWVKDTSDSRGGYYSSYYAYWYGITKNTVCFRLDVDCGHEDGGGFDFACLFERINGKWYLTQNLMAG